MAIFAIGDLHLSTGCNKPMDIFSGWQDYVGRITSDWRSRVDVQDTVVIAGDISWGMNFKEAKSDFELLHSLPGRKILMKGNHDYWWNSRKKMEEFFDQNGLTSLTILHNSCVAAEGVALCGTRGWMLEEECLHDRTVAAREEGRLRASLEAAKKLELAPVAFLHYPPLFADSVSGGMIDLLREYGVKRCFYGHLHGAACPQAFEGEYLGIEFSLISADHLKFRLKEL